MISKKLLLIVNPRSGRAKMRTELLRVVEIFSAENYDVTVYPTKAHGDATQKIATLSEGDYDLIIVCGGDGTLNEVISGLMQAKLTTKVGYIPSGTLNEWSSGLGISKIIKEAAEDIIKGKVISLDIGKFGNKYFTYTASFGAFTAASYSTPQDIKNVLGQAAYLFEGIKSLGAIKPIHLKFTCEEREIEGDFLFGAISNSLSVGGIVKFDQNVVKLNDGLFEVLLIRNPESVLGFQPLIDGILRHELDREGIEFFHTKEITITGGKDVDWTLDGEYSEGSDNFTITNLNNAVNFIVPDED